jgi:phosphate transport system protein
MADHIVSSYDAELQDLRRTISEMGGIAEKMLADAITALVRGDTALAQAVIAIDPRLDALQRAIEERAILTLVRRQPMAVDLRETVSAIRISGDLERIGDLAKNIAKRVTAISGQFQPQKIVAGIQHMSDLAFGQLKDVLDAYAQKQDEAAMDVWRRDGAIDALYTSLFRELLTYMMEDPRNIAFCTHLLFAAKNIERIGDHTTNIAETVHYLVTGENLVAERPKDDRSSFESIEAET